MSLQIDNPKTLLFVTLVNAIVDISSQHIFGSHDIPLQDFIDLLIVIFFNPYLDIVSLEEIIMNMI